ncbi:MAG: peptidylprolyl isomerase, partial [Anaerolineae bacterium]
LLVQEVEEAAFSMAPGERSGVVASDWGYHIVETIAFEDARPVDEATRQRLVSRADVNWIGQLRADAEIQQLIDLPL